MAEKISIAEINAREPSKLVAACDRRMDARVRETAEKIRANLTRSPIVLLSGPSGSGKTTTAMKLSRELRTLGVITHTVSIDDYFVSIDPRTAPRTPEGEIDYESPECVDMELLSEHFDVLSQGGEIRIPHFMFARQKRSASQFTPLRLEKNEIAIFEGIHALNDDIAGPHPEALKLYISADMDFVNQQGETVLMSRQLRLMRRVIRDDKFRGADARFTLELWENVLRGEEQHILPYMGRADVSINSALRYEPGVMKNTARQLFNGLDAVAPEAGVLEMLEGLEYFKSIDEGLVPADSLLREFIGGSVYYNN